MLDLFHVNLARKMTPQGTRKNKGMGHAMADFESLRTIGIIVNTLGLQAKDAGSDLVLIHS